MPWPLIGAIMAGAAKVGTAAASAASTAGAAGLAGAKYVAGAAVDVGKGALAGGAKAPAGIPGQFGGAIGDLARGTMANTMKQAPPSVAGQIGAGMGQAGQLLGLAKGLQQRGLQQAEEQEAVLPQRRKMRDMMPRGI